MFRVDLRPLVLAIVIPALLASCSDDNGEKKLDTGPSKIDTGSTSDTSQATCEAPNLLPQDDAVGDFKRKGTPQLAKDSKGLFDLINGGAEKYLDNKFVCIALLEYESATKSQIIEVRLFDQADTAGAEAAYKATEHVDNVPITPTIGDASRETVGMNNYSAEMRKGRYLAQLSIDGTDKDDTKALLQVIADAI